MASFHQGYFTPKHRAKYVGNVDNIFYRSSWEKKFMIWCDNNPAVLRWNNEELVVPYFSPVDNKMHRYFVDFVIEVNNRSGERKKYAIEIKPDAQTKAPRNSKNRSKQRVINETMTYVVNKAKWSAATEFCAKVGMEFKVLTEHDLGIK